MRSDIIKNIQFKYLIFLVYFMQIANPQTSLFKSINELSKNQKIWKQNGHSRTDSNSMYNFK